MDHWLMLVRDSCSRPVTPTSPCSPGWLSHAVRRVTTSSDCQCMTDESVYSSVPRYGCLGAEDEAQLDHRLPGWRQSEVHGEREARWQAVCAALLKFTQLHGRLPSTQEEHEGERVGVWLHKQRYCCRAGTLSPERDRALAAVCADWATVRK